MREATSEKPESEFVVSSSQRSSEPGFATFFLVGGTHISLAHGELHSNDYVYILFNFVYIEHSFQC